MVYDYNWYIIYIYTAPFDSSSEDEAISDGAPNKNGKVSLRLALGNSMWIYVAHDAKNH